jgi:type III secretory pathway component EscR
MENIGVVFPAIMMVGLGIAIGMYVSSQLKCSIRKNIHNNNIKKYERTKDSK